MTERTCSIDGCSRPLWRRGLCAMHHHRLRRHGDTGPAGRLRNPPDPDARCSADGCTNKAHARGLCGKHYQQDRAVRNGAAQCRRAGCTLLAVLDGLCKPHYDRRRAMDEEQELRDARRCLVEGCDRPYNATGYCKLHYQRIRLYGAPGPAVPQRAARRTGYVDRQGYRHVYADDGRRVMEHRLVMERLLGRELRRHENVHHVNGQRADNSTDGPLRGFRSGNLELWSSWQPAGQRVADKVGFALALLAEYEPGLLSGEGRARAAAA